MISQKYIGRKCRDRRRELGITQAEVAKSVGYSVSNISHFEHGRTDNVIIFLWYVYNGLDMDTILRGYYDAKNN